MNHPDVDVLESGEEQLKMPIDDLVENPLANYPDLDPCLCGSGHIWRRCHKSQMIAMIPKSEAEKIEKFLERKSKLKTKE